MRIKELHLRNIASIEKADIDFENGLNDIVTATPAGVFLISGDTGAGKSVILDGISMALYKNTPRIASGLNRINNEFKNSNGEVVNINSISQYTRIGISNDDDCYSEVVFVGNDNIEYRAKLTLGLILGRTNKETGMRHLKYKQPSWEVKVGNEDWKNVESKTGQPILDAVGLSFEQFGRMAMLAQGQFASFLTGDKNERVSILERLTNTEIFSVYGDAINNIYKRAEERKKQDMMALDANKNYALSEEEVGRLESELKEKEANKNDLKQKYDLNDKKLNLLSAIESHRKTILDARNEKESYEREMETDEYKNKKVFVESWDATIEQRKMLSDLNDARKQYNDSERQLDFLREKFDRLSSGLLAERDDYNLKLKELEVQKEWLDKQSDKTELYSKAGEVDVKLANLEVDNDSKAKADAEVAQLQKQSQLLNDNVSKSIAEFDAAKEKLNQKQSEIDLLGKDCEALNLIEINKKIELATERNHSLDSLKKDLEEYEKYNDLVRDKNEELKETDNNVANLLCIRNKAENVYQEKKHKDDEARNILNTMKMSTNDLIVNLRKKLYDEKTDICPLCGQRINELHIEKDFENLVTPFQKMQDKTAKALAEAEMQRKTANDNYTSETVLLSAKKNEYKRICKEAENKKNEVDKKVSELGFDTGLSILAQVESEQNNMATQLQALMELQEKAVLLQKKINQLIEEKKPLENNFAKAEKTKLLAENARDNNNRNINIHNQHSEEAGARIKSLYDDLNALLAVAYVGWDNNIGLARNKLSQDAKEYNDKKQLCDQGFQSLVRKKDMVAKLEALRESILKVEPAWKKDLKAEPYVCDDVHIEWTGLYADCQTEMKKKESATERINSIQPKLEIYYSDSGMTDVMLAEIESKSKELDSDRKYINNVVDKYNSSVDVIKRAELAIADTMKEIGADSEDNVPNKENLKKEKDEMSVQLQELDNNIGAISSKLEENSKNTSKQKELVKKLNESVDVFNKWDRINSIFGKTRFRTLVQTYILRPLLNNANIYLTKITDRYTLTCSEDNEQLSILVHDRYNKDQVRSVTVLSGGERFMISLSLSLALSSLNRPGLNVNILFIDEGFGTLDEKNLDSVMSTLEKLQEIAGQSNRRVGIISHREELNERIPVQIRVEKKGEGRSIVKVVHE